MYSVSVIHTHFPVAAEMYLRKIHDERLKCGWTNIKSIIMRRCHWQRIYHLESEWVGGVDTVRVRDIELWRKKFNFLILSQYVALTTASSCVIDCNANRSNGIWTTFIQN